MNDDPYFNIAGWMEQYQKAIAKNAINNVIAGAANAMNMSVLYDPSDCLSKDRDPELVLHKNVGVCSDCPLMHADPSTSEMHCSVESRAGGCLDESGMTCVDEFLNDSYVVKKKWVAKNCPLDEIKLSTGVGFDCKADVIEVKSVRVSMDMANKYGMHHLRRVSPDEFARFQRAMWSDQYAYPIPYPKTWTSASTSTWEVYTGGTGDVAYKGDGDIDKTKVKQYWSKLKTWWDDWT